MLAVSFSGTDRVFHAFGPYSWEMQDTLYRLDRSVGELIAAAERAAGGRANLVVVLTADHGGAAAPEHWAAEGLPATAVQPQGPGGGAHPGAARALPAGGGERSPSRSWTCTWVASRSTEGKVDGAAVRRAAAEWLSTAAGHHAAVARDDLYTAPDVAGLLEPLRKGYYAGRSGDVLYMPQPFQVITTYTQGHQPQHAVQLRRAGAGRLRLARA